MTLNAIHNRTPYVGSISVELNSSTYQKSPNVMFGRIYVRDPVGWKTYFFASVLYTHPSQKKKKNQPTHPSKNKLLWTFQEAHDLRLAGLTEMERHFSWTP